MTKNGYRLLVVEDDPMLCESIADLLRETGYEVDTALDGESALRKLRHGPRPTAILLDVVLPRLSAEGLLRSLDRELSPRPPVVLMTGMATAALAPSEEVLLKPFEVDELLSRLARACGAGAAPGLGTYPPSLSVPL